MTELFDDIYEEILSLLGPHSQMLFRLTNKANFAAPKTELLTEYLKFLKDNEIIYIVESLTNMIHYGYKKLSKWMYISGKYSKEESDFYYSLAIFKGYMDLAMLIQKTEKMSLI